MTSKFNSKSSNFESSPAKKVKLYVAEYILKVGYDIYSKKHLEK